MVSQGVKSVRNALLVRGMQRSEPRYVYRVSAHALDKAVVLCVPGARLMIIRSTACTVT
jgi:hypothetical protein